MRNVSVKKRIERCSATAQSNTETVHYYSKDLSFLLVLAQNGHIHIHIYPYTKDTKGKQKQNKNKIKQLSLKF